MILRLKKDKERLNEEKKEVNDGSQKEAERERGGVLVSQQNSLLFGNHRL